MNQIIKSLLNVCIVSFIVSYIGYFFTSIEYMPRIFLIATILQFIFFYFYNNIITYITKLKLEKENLQTIQLINTNIVLINCSSCKKVNNVRLILTQPNNFICEHCSTENIIEIEYKTITKTKIYD